MKKITIIGAGFSGMSLAYCLVKHGFQVEIFEKNSKSGGMIQTSQSEFGIAEQAANGFLNTAQLEIFLKEINADYIGSSDSSKKRFIFRRFPKRWPLNFTESLVFLFKILKFLLKPKSSRLAHKLETIEQWGLRNFGFIATQYLIAPALQGIYAGDIQKMSASLILNKIFNQKREKKLSRSSLFSSLEGMGHIMQQLEMYLQKSGVKFHYSSEVEMKNLNNPFVLATSAFNAAELLSQANDNEAKSNAEIIKKIEFLPLTTATCFFEKAPEKYQGFGILFPQDSNIKALGLLMNNSIFNRHQSMHSETWILGGTFDKEIILKNENEIKDQIKECREKVFQKNDVILHINITKWPKALPHYTIDLEQQLNQLKPMKNIYLHGNYLGNIGLSRLLESSQKLAAQILKEVM